MKKVEMERLTLIKVGGKIVEEAETLHRLLNDFAAIDGYKVLVHGGGRSATKLASRLGIESQMVNGRRITDASMLEIVTMVYGGLVNKNIVAGLQALGVNALGLTGADMNLMRSEKRPVKDVDYGFVGDVKEVNGQILYDLLEKDFLPIVCPVGLDDEFNTYNINADDAACAIAKAVKAEKLAFLTDIEGVYKDPDDPSTLISELHVDDARKLMEQGYIGGGMLPKLQNCIDAIEVGVSRVHILDGRIPHCLLLEIFTNKGIGTAILNSEESRYYHGE